MAAIPGAGLIARFFGRTVSEGAAFAIGAATGPALRPITQEVINETWKLHPVRPPEVGTLALGVAQGQVDPVQAAEWAKQHGFSQTAFDALVDIANTGPGVPTALDLWRRGLMDEAGFRRAAKRNGIEEEWIAEMVALKIDRLDPSVVANAVQQGHVPPGDILPPPVTGRPPFDIPLTQIPLDPLEEWAAQGIDEPRGRVMANLVGLPPGDHEMLQMWNRGIITEASVDAGIREGHRKTKWIPAVKELRHAVLTATQYAGLWLRNWVTQAEAVKGGALTGYSAEQMDLLYKLQGRPPSPTQMWTAWAREAPGPFGGTFDFEDFSDGIRRSNIRTEYVDTLWAIRFNYPSLFQMRQLVSSGTLPPATALDILHKQRYPDDLAQMMVTGWTAQGTARQKGLTAAALLDEFEGHYIDQAQLAAGLTALGYSPAAVEMETNLAEARRVKKARDQSVEAIRKAYLTHAIPESDAQQRLAGEGIPEPALGLIIAEWRHQLDATKKVLTPTQIRAAYRKNLLTQGDALAELEERGYTPADAGVYLAS